MARARNKRKASNPRRGTRLQPPLARTEVERPLREPRPNQLWPGRVRAWIARANRAVLAAVGAGLIAIITGWVTDLPHALHRLFSGSPPLLTVNGRPTQSTDIGAADPCEISGTFVVPGMVRAAGNIRTGQLASLINGAADADSTSGTYTLQAAPNETVVVTAIHTVVASRAPAPRATIISIQSGCAGAALQKFSVSVNLDAANLTPQVHVGGNRGTGARLPNGLQTVVTNNGPILIDFTATTHKYDVRWRFRVDYTVNGQQKSAWIQDGSQPFQTIASRPDDSGYTFTLNPDQTSWASQGGVANQ